MTDFNRTNIYGIKEDNQGDKILDVLNFGFVKLLRTLQLGKIHTVVKDEEFNLPLISWREFGVKDAWWLIAQFNGIIDPMSEITIGKELRIPTIDSIESSLEENKASEQESGGSRESSGSSSSTAKFPRNIP